MRSTAVYLSAIVLGSALSVQACGSEADFQVIRKRQASRAGGFTSGSAAGVGATNTVAAPTRTDEASAYALIFDLSTLFLSTDSLGVVYRAQITDPAQECSVYSYPPVAALQAAKVFPPIWEIANLRQVGPLMN